MTLSSYSSVLLSLLTASLTITKHHLAAIHLNFNKWFRRGVPRMLFLFEFVLSVTVLMSSIMGK